MGLRTWLKKTVSKSKIKKAIEFAEQIDIIVTDQHFNVNSLYKTMDQKVYDAIQKFEYKYKIKVPKEAYPLVKEILKKRIQGVKPGQLKSEFAAQFYNLLAVFGKELLFYLFRKYLPRVLIALGV